MTWKEELLRRFSGEATGRPLFMPDLTLWYEWHQIRGTLPERCQDRSLSQIARLLGGPGWLPVEVWTTETPGIRVKTVETGEERVTTYETSGETLVARWTLGPDGDWWQTEYPVKSEEHLEAAVELVGSRRYILDPSKLLALRTYEGNNDIVTLSLPKRPYSEVLHAVLGWSAGLLLLGEPEIEKMLTLMESKLQNLVERVTELPGQIVLSPDNLDGQFISPGAFDRYLTASYRRTAEILHSHGKRLMVHVGGPVRRLLAPLAATGVDGIQGICGPPQSDASLSEARKIVGPQVTLWGGIPQDVLLEAHPWKHFEAAILQAAEEATGDPRMILGVADRVPVCAEWDRLEKTPALINPASTT